MMSNPALSEKIHSLGQFIHEAEKGVRSLKETQLHTRLLVDKFQEGRLIDFDTLASVTINSQLTLASGVTSYRVPLAGGSSSRIAFVTTFAPGATLPNHHHDCLEAIQILSGDLADNNKGATLPKQTTYEPMEPHELHSFRGALLMVYFEK